jgi:prolyl oligopeptidase
MQSINFSATTATTAPQSQPSSPLGTQNTYYPPTEKIPVTDVIHGIPVQDNYHWLEEESDKTQKWVQEQDRLTQSYFKDNPHVKKLLCRFRELYDYDDSTFPSRLQLSDRVFFKTKLKNQEKWVYQTKIHPTAPSQILFDPNTWPKEKSLAFVASNWDGKYIAYGVSESGNENPEVKILDLTTGQTLNDTIYGWKIRSVEWDARGTGFFYNANPVQGSVPDGEEHYWFSTYYHKLHTQASSDVKVFSHSTNKECYHSIAVTEDGKYELLWRSQFSEKEIFFRPHQPGIFPTPTPLSSGFVADFPCLDIFQEKIYILTDLNAPMKQLFVTDVTRPDQKDWKTLIPQRESHQIKSFQIIEGRIYLTIFHHASTYIEIYDLNGTYLKNVPLPGIGTGSVGGFQAAKPGVKVHYTSFFHPSETYWYDFDTNHLTSVHKCPVPADPSPYETKQVWFPSKDGTPISMFILAKKGTPIKGDLPTLLSGYGGFNVSVRCEFRCSYLTWLEAGGIVALPNLRGGGEYGKEWHEGGMKEKKQNVFDDFIAAAEYLIKQNYTCPQKLAISGGSNGGLLVAAAMMQRPELFQAVLCQVPLTDMINYHKWGLANIWAKEFGSSEKPEEFLYLLKYSPYHNVKDGQHYPAALITASDNDSRVDPCHAKKMVARLQEANGSNHPILLYYKASSGHHGGTTLTQYIETVAVEQGFLMTHLGVV